MHSALANSARLARPSHLCRSCQFQRRLSQASSIGCSNGQVAPRNAIRPVTWTYIPYQVPYALGLKLQEHLVQRRADARALLREEPSASPAAKQSPSSRLTEATEVATTDIFLLLQHSPVFTEGRRGGEYAQTPEEEAAIAKRFAEIGADYHVTKRGGLITFHGPGQLVGYPILDLSVMNLSTRCYVDKIQTSISNLLHSSPYNLATVPPPEDHTGVWVDTSHKITSIGIQVRHRITSHGFALNVEADVLKWFGWIVACGIKGKGMTCIQREIALRVQREGATRPDRRGGQVDEARKSDLPHEQESPSSPLPSSAGLAVASIGPGVGLVDTPITLGPEAKAVTVESIVSPLVQQFGRTWGREMQQADKSMFHYAADARGLLSKVIVKGKIVQ
ncbi:lipoyltransferase [Tilletiaria anomala UBC 951]|uniref:lipoyl(octanoyl) transferase n=1 Tax=Tilletiaria anomala (strain ATCC 24038 / CBS 436.72 / UBC 951) TaxID=1037660 RepID=A0A066WFK5_TILAU|nr:lipoyltransferase [Tilletiaria anomala UBC 951]KDN51298.1 lipoyltransferase [Tilletiaria anomala UBC 951]